MSKTKQSLIFFAAFAIFLLTFSNLGSAIFHQVGLFEVSGTTSLQAASATTRQKGYEFDLNPDGNPNGGENGSGVNIPVVNVSNNDPFAIRIGVQRDEGGGAPLKLNGNLEYDITSAFTSPITVTTSTSINAFALVANSGYANHAATTQELLAVTDGTFVAGEAIDGDNGDFQTNQITIARGEVTEVQFNIEATTNAISG